MTTDDKVEEVRKNVVLLLQSQTSQNEAISAMMNSLIAITEVLKEGK